MLASPWHPPFFLCTISCFHVIADFHLPYALLLNVHIGAHYYGLPPPRAGTNASVNHRRRHRLSRSSRSTRKDLLLKLTDYN